ncbi:putative ABC transport system permease protein [Caldanaerovirga acetigignens]|uniref:Putative ABC transport system permease protein n=1 Tax=Caldanaerovirga acetigignens TaxID=447595 RepID=A0A1M7HJV0_9FIRM|nr:ABC transporter permease [Caldanaerovirga acetigignens]SHM28821.1 putative ABC transport system permease protein [Caldanaerovirga acetigignens]
MLRQKMLRDLKENKGSYIACTTIIFLGLMIFISLTIVVQNLRISQKTFYKELNFADGFIRLRGIPSGEVKRLESIKGIQKVQGRMVKDVIVLMPGTSDNVYLRLVSVDPNQKDPINGVLLIKGLHLEDDSLSIWVDSKFFKTHNLKIGNKIQIIASGKVRELSIAGSGDSPEFVYALRTASDLYPSPETFGIAFMPIKSMKKLFPNDNLFNEIVFTLKPETDFEKVKEELEKNLSKYGIESIIPRSEQLSHLLLDMELQSVESMSRAMPLLFLSIAGVILYITLKRLIEQQRVQIGILKAMGYTSREILLHYMSYAIFLGFVGGFSGSLSGAFLSFPLASMYSNFFNLPNLKGNFSPTLIFCGILLSLLTSLIAGYQGCKKVLVLEPAEAMRPPTPPYGKKIFLENIRLLWKVLTVQEKMAVRNLSRNVGRSLFIFFGIMISFAISTFTWSMNDLVHKMMFDQYEKVEVYDVKINFTRPLHENGILYELSNLFGIRFVEPVLEVPATIKNQWLKKEAVILGLTKSSRLYNIMDKNYNKVSIPKNGILISERLAKLLRAKVGTKLVVESPFRTDKDPEIIEVAGIIPQYVGLNAYMEIGALQEFLKQRDIVTSALIKIEPQAIKSFKQKYMYSKYINSIEERKQRLSKMKEMMASYGSMIYIYAILGIIIGFAIIYSSLVISLSERSRELSSMMVLGMNPEEVFSVVTFEQWFISIPAMILGIPLSKAMMAGISRFISNDMFSIPEILTLKSLILAFTVTTSSIITAQRAALRKIKFMNILEVLKSVE